MSLIKTRSGFRKREPYPRNQFPRAVIEKLAERIVYAWATGRGDISGEDFGDIFAEAIDGRSLNSPLGVADVIWERCAWSVKTVKNTRPHAFVVGRTNKPKNVRLISGRNSPIYSADIQEALADPQKTGDAVIEIYNSRIDEALRDHDDLRLLAFVRCMIRGEFTIFERALAPLAVNNYVWRKNARNNLEAYEGDRHAFTWQPHGSQFTIIEQIPSGAKRFRITKKPARISVKALLDAVGFDEDWVEEVD